MPLHVSKNFNGQLTGQTGVHKMLEVGLVKRYADFYAAEIAKGRAEPAYQAAPLDRLFDWIVVANSRVPPILAADAAGAEGHRLRAAGVEGGRRQGVGRRRVAERAPYYAAFKKELEARSSPEAAAMRDAAAHLADLYYTAWTNAGKPLSLSPAAPAAEKETPSWVWMLPMVGSPGGPSPASPPQAGA